MSLAFPPFLPLRVSTVSVPFYNKRPTTYSLFLNSVEFLFFEKSEREREGARGAPKKRGGREGGGGGVGADGKFQEPNSPLKAPSSGSIDLLKFWGRKTQLTIMCGSFRHLRPLGGRVRVLPFPPRPPPQPRLAAPAAPARNSAHPTPRRTTERRTKPGTPLTPRGSRPSRVQPRSSSLRPIGSAQSA